MVYMVTDRTSECDSPLSLPTPSSTPLFINPIHKPLLNYLHDIIQLHFVSAHPEILFCGKVMNPSFARRSLWKALLLSWRRGALSLVHAHAAVDKPGFVLPSKRDLTCPGFFTLGNYSPSQKCGALPTASVPDRSSSPSLFNVERALTVCLLMRPPWARLLYPRCPSTNHPQPLPPVLCCFSSPTPHSPASVTPRISLFLITEPLQSLCPPPCLHLDTLSLPFKRVASFHFFRAHLGHFLRETPNSSV